MKNFTLRLKRTFSEAQLAVAPCRRANVIQTHTHTQQTFVSQPQAWTSKETEQWRALRQANFPPDFSNLTAHSLHQQPPRWFVATDPGRRFLARRKRAREGVEMNSTVAASLSSPQFSRSISKLVARRGVCFSFLR